MSTPDSEAGIRVYDTSEPLIPYTSQTCSDEEWCSAAVGKWEEMGLPESAVPDPLWERCYIRWGDMPKGGQSFNHQLRELEPGVAVFRAYKAARSPGPKRGQQNLVKNNTKIVHLDHALAPRPVPHLGRSYERRG